MNGMVLMRFPHIPADEPTHTSAGKQVRSVVLLRCKPRDGYDAGQCTGDNRNQFRVPVLVGNHRRERPDFDCMPRGERSATVKETSLVVFRIRTVTPCDG